MWVSDDSAWERGVPPAVLSPNVDHRFRKRAGRPRSHATFGLTSIVKR
jgi:hypothetical protein